MKALAPRSAVGSEARRAGWRCCLALVLSGAAVLPVFAQTLPALSFKDTNPRANEDRNDSMLFEVVLDAASGSQVTVDYATADKTAKAGEDYTAASGTLTFAPGDTSKSVSVAVLDDDRFEGIETFTMTLSGAVGATVDVDVGTATGTIEETEVAPNLTIRGREVVEGSPLIYDVTLTRAVAATVRVFYLTEDFDPEDPPALALAEAGTDFVAKSGRLTFAPGETSKTISISVVDDSDVEPDEAVVVTLRDPINAFFVPRSETAATCPWSACAFGSGGQCCDCGTILNDDVVASTEIALSATPSAVSEGAGSTEVEVTASLDGGARTAATTVTVTVTGSGAAGAVGFAAVPAFDVVIAAGATSGSGSFALVPEDDGADEADETLTLAGSSDLPVTPATVTLTDEDEKSIRVLAIADAEAVESAGEVRFEVMLDGPGAADVTVSYATADPVGLAGPAAEAGFDYEAASGTLAFAPGEASRTIRVPLLGDGMDEPDERFALILSDPRGATLGRGMALGTIRDDDEPPALSATDAAGDESVGALEFEVTLSAPSGNEVSASYATADGSATAGSDYEAAAGTLVFAPGDVSRTVRVAILDDAAHEADEETFELSLSALVNATAADVSATGTIRDDDLAPPTLAGQLPPAMLCVGGVPYELDLAEYFGGDELRFSATSSTPEVATAALAGSRLTVAPVSEGESSVTVTAGNAAGSVESAVRVRVVTDPAEIEAIGSALASIGRVVLTSVTGSVRDRFSEPITSMDDTSGEERADSHARAVVGNRWPAPSSHGVRFDEWDAGGLFESGYPVGDRPATTSPAHRRGMAPFSFSLDSGRSATAGTGWSVWGRGDVRGFESGTDGDSHDGTITSVHLGTDARRGDWLAGISVARGAAEADYRFERSADACGGAGGGDGTINADLTSAHPYAGRRVGAGWVWATLGAGGGEMSAERCESGHRVETDLSMRLAAAGGRHPFARGERVALSIMEEVGMLDLTTGDAPGPVGDRSVRVGQARIGLEASGVVPPGCRCSLSSFARAFARGDWGDGITGAGLELAAGVRFRNFPLRLGLDAGIRALAWHSDEDVRERGANLSVSILPKPDETGWRASLAWRRGADRPRFGGTDGMAPWFARAGVPPGANRDWTSEFRLGYGIALRRGLATPFADVAAGGSDSGGARFGVRYALGDRAWRLATEWSVGQGAGNGIALEFLGRF